MYAKTESGDIGTVIMYNCVAYENGYLEYTQAENNARFPEWRDIFNEANTNSYLTREIAVCDTAVKYVAVTYRKFSGETVGIFAVSFVIVVFPSITECTALQTTLTRA